jgi:hypothetical protein
VAVVPAMSAKSSQAPRATAVANSRGVTIDWLSPKRAMDDSCRLWFGVDSALLEVLMVLVVRRELVGINSWTCFNPYRVPNSSAASAPETSWMNVIELVREMESLMFFRCQFNGVRVHNKIVWFS